MLERRHEKYHQHLPSPLLYVRDDIRLLNVAYFVEHRVGELGTLVLDGDSAIRIVKYANFFTLQIFSEVSRFEQVNNAIVLHRETVGNRSCFLRAEDLIELIIRRR